MAEIKVGDTVEIVNYNDYWNGTQATVVSINGRDSEDSLWGEFPYKLKALTDTPIRHKKAGEIVGNWSDKHIRRAPTKVDETIAGFLRVVDVFRSETTGCAVVLLPTGKLVRILSDGTIDK